MAGTQEIQARIDVAFARLDDADRDNLEHGGARVSEILARITEEVGTPVGVYLNGFGRLVGYRVPQLGDAR